MENAVGDKPSYTTAGVAPWRVLTDGYHQLRSVRRQVREIGPHVTNVLRDLDRLARSITEHTGLELHGLRALEIGHGQVQVLIGYMASLGNDVTGIDLEAAPAGLTDIPGYWQLYRRNGAMRVLKTAGRELSGINRALRREFCRQRGLGRWPIYRQFAMDATRLTFDDASFDLVYSTDVFEHLPDPAACLREARRVLRPDGGYFIRTVHFGQYNALHDLRWMTRPADAPPGWAHLLDDLRDQVVQGAWVNDLRWHDWERLARSVWPDSKVVLQPLEHPVLAAQLAGLRSAGRLPDYSDAELMASHVIMAGRNPDPVAG